MSLHKGNYYKWQPISAKKGLSFRIFVDIDPHFLYITVIAEAVAMLKDFLKVPTGLQMVDPICRFRWGQLFFGEKYGNAFLYQHRAIHARLHACKDRRLYNRMESAGKIQKGALVYIFGINLSPRRETKFWRRK